MPDLRKAGAAGVPALSTITNSWAAKMTAEPLIVRGLSIREHRTDWTDDYSRSPDWPTQNYFALLKLHSGSFLCKSKAMELHVTIAIVAPRYASMECHETGPC